MSHLLTVLDATVAPGREADLEAAYAEAAQGPFPPGLVRSALLRDTGDPTHWRIETVWESPQALAAMRGTGKPRGIQIFEAAGATPTLSLFEARGALLVSPTRSGTGA